MKKSQDKQKYTHFLKQIFINRFLIEVTGDIRQLRPKTVIDIGCGEGYPEAFILSRLPQLKITGLDLSEKLLKQAKARNPQVKYLSGDIFNLKFKTDQFDLALVMEVLEHLPNPEKAIEQVRQVSAKAVFTVPYEPWFSIMSLTGGNYLRTLGRHPGHINSWNSVSFKKILSGYYNKVKVRTVLPWIIAICEK